MQYLVGQMLMCLLIAGILGLLIGWLLWGILLRKSRERAMELEQRVSKLSGFPAKLTDLEGTHSAFVASKNEEAAKCKARIAELELVAKKVPELEANLAGKIAEWEGIKAQLAGKTTELAGLQAKFSDLETQHKAALGAVEHLPELTSRLQASEAQTAQIQDLTEQLKSKDAEIAEHVQAHADKDARLSSLVSRIADLEPAALRVPQLEAQVVQVTAAHAEKVAEVEKHIDAHREKDEHLEELIGKVHELKPLTSQVTDLRAQVDEQVAAHAEKDSRIAELAPLAALLPELRAASVAKDKHVFGLLGQVDELKTQAASSGDLQSRLESAQYETNLATRRWRMAEAGLASHQSEVSTLQDQILVLKGEIQTLKQQHESTAAELELAKAEPLKAKAAAASMGFFDPGNGAAKAAPEPPQDHVREFEKRIEELRSIEASKDAEIGKLSSRLTAIEAQPDTDTKRQILFAAKNAELNQLRGVLDSLFQPLSQDEVALRAFSYAKERGFSGGSPMEDWMRAERDCHFGRLGNAWESTRIGTMF